MTINTRTGTLQPAAPYDLRHTLDVLSWFVPLRGEQTLEEGALIRTLSYNGAAVLYRLENAGTVEQPLLRYTLWSGAALDAQAEAEILDRIGFFLSLDDDLMSLYNAAKGDAPFETVVEKLYGYHQVKFPSAFETAVWGMLTQRNTGTVSHNMKLAIKQALGPTVTVGGIAYQAFPEPDALAALSVGEIAELIGHAPKAAFVSAVAEAFSRIDERWLRSLSIDEASRWLKIIHGVGAWSAGFILIRGLGKMDWLPHGDTRLVGAVSQIYERPLTWPEVAQLAERYGDQKGYWSHYVRIAT
jgi:DNA-3-methyladenine glycosylase II